MPGKDTLVIIPAFNEAESIGVFLDKLIQASVQDMADILIINDGSADDTSQIVKDKGFEIISHIYNLGYGCALQTGYKHAVRKDYDYLIQIDSDGQHDVCNIENILNVLKSRDVDIVIGSRFLKGSTSSPVSSMKMVAIKLFRGIIKSITHQQILDPTSGLQGLNRRAFLYYSYYNNFVSDFPDANMIIQVLLNDFKTEEVPVIMHSRETGTSMHSGLKPIWYIIKMSINIAIVIIREKYFKKR